MSMCTKCIITPIVFLIIVISALFLIWSDAFAAPAKRPSIIINEVAWAGTEENSNHEWIELFNASSETISLDGWNLTAEDGSPAIALSGTYPAGSYILLERTSDDSVPGIPAHIIYTGALSNSGEYLILTDSSGNMEDGIFTSAGWLAGDNSTKTTLARRADGSWDYGIAGGTPRAQNIFSISYPTPKEADIPPPDDALLESIGTHVAGEFEVAIAERSSEQKMFRAFILLLGIMALGGIGFFIKTKLRPSA